MKTSLAGPSSTSHLPYPCPALSHKAWVAQIRMRDTLRLQMVEMNDSWHCICPEVHPAPDEIYYILGAATRTPLAYPYTPLAYMYEYTPLCLHVHPLGET